MRAALVNPTNSDIYTTEFAEFVETFGRVGDAAYLPHAFFVAGGALGVENALKAAIDWKVRRNFRKGADGGAGPPGPALPRGLPRPHRLHALADQHRRPAQAPVLRQVRLAAHHQPGAALPGRRARRSRAWRTVERQAVAEIKPAFAERKDDIAAIIIEPIQAEGGDNHFRPRVPAGAAAAGRRDTTRCSSSTRCRAASA